MVEHEINSLDNFIGGWYLTDTSICDRIKQQFDNSTLKRTGLVGSAEGFEIKQDVKRSVDLRLDEINSEIADDYLFNHLQPVVNEYRNKYRWADEYGTWKLVECPNIQCYEPNGGFYAWHCERSTCVKPAADRHLVFMTYLNDVDDAGETEFYYQKLKVKPQKGLTLIWPSEWTFTHRGIPSPTQQKYVLTGWYSYVD